jgi:hypothetical protein
MMTNGLTIIGEILTRPANSLRDRIALWPISRYNRCCAVLELPA